MAHCLYDVCPALLQGVQVKLVGQLEQRARWPHFNNISAIRGVQSSHSDLPPQPRGVNSRSQISLPACFIHHPFCLLVSYFPQSVFLADVMVLYTNWINTKLTTHRWRNRFALLFLYMSPF